MLEGTKCIITGQNFISGMLNSIIKQKYPFGPHFQPEGREESENRDA